MEILKPKVRILSLALRSDVFGFASPALHILPKASSYEMDVTWTENNRIHRDIKSFPQPPSLAELVAALEASIDA